MARKRKYRRTSKRNTPFSRWLRRVPLPVVLLLCLLSWMFPEQSRTIFGELQDDIPVFRELTSRLGMRRGQNTAGTENFEIHFLDVGEGLSVLVRSDTHAMLYDGGDRDVSSFVVSYLRDEGIYTLDYVIASHYDADHISGLIGALNNFEVEHVIGPDYVHDSKTYRSFMDAVASQGLTVEHPSPGDMYTLGDAGFTVLAPAEISEDSNNNSVAVRVVNKDNSFLLMGDAEKPSEEAVCASTLKLESDVLCPGHHGSTSSTCEEFLQEVKPKFAVISCGKENEYGHPHWETLERLSQYGVTVYRTDEIGTVIAYSNGDEIWWEMTK